MTERAAVSEYNRSLTSKDFGDEGVILEEVLSILEDAQVCSSASGVSEYNNDVQHHGVFRCTTLPNCPDGV